MRLPLPLFVCLLIGVSVPAANAQNRESMMDRLSKLEEEVNLIKDHPQIAPTAPSADGAAPVAAMAPADAAQINVKLSEIQTEIRSFRGKLEEMEHEQRKMNTRFEKFERDADARILALENAKTPTAAMPPVITEPKAAEKPTEKPVEKPVEKAAEKPAEKAADKIVKPVITNSKPEAGKSAKRIEIGKKEEPVKKEEVAKKTDVSVVKEGDKPEEPKPEVIKPDVADSAEKSDVKPEAIKVDSATSREQYDAAFKLLNQGDYEKARSQFSEFVKAHPSDELVGNAYYWLGETYYIKQQYGKSADEYRKGYEAMPEGTKASDNLFKLSKSLAQDKREKEACVVLAQILKKYSSDSKSVARKAANESKKLKCEQ